MQYLVIGKSSQSQKILKADYETNVSGYLRRQKYLNSLGLNIAFKDYNHRERHIVKNNIGFRC